MIIKILQRFLVASVYLFLYTPIVVLIVFSFNSKGFPSPWDSFTLKWYVELFHSSELWQSFINSLIVAITATFLSLSMGSLLIYFQASGGKIGKAIPLFYGNLIIPETVFAISLLGYFSILSVPLGLLTVIIAHTAIGLGFVLPILYIRYKSLDPKLMEASLVLGATPAQTFFKITLPMLRPSLIATGLLIFIISFDDFILTFFCAGTKVQTLPLHLFAMIRSGISPTVNALSAFLLLLSGIFVALFFSPKLKNRVF
ncbi:MAG: ABC transporter permease [Simkaniaceae bacterium]|nr:ABC transporter permease [Simkaniaceae bacterium]